jgi:hypothetical protein
MSFIQYKIQPENHTSLIFPYPFGNVHGIKVKFGDVPFGSLFTDKDRESIFFNAGITNETKHYGGFNVIRIAGKNIGEIRHYSNSNVVEVLPIDIIRKYTARDYVVLQDKNEKDFLDWMDEQGKETKKIAAQNGSLAALEALRRDQHDKIDAECRSKSEVAARAALEMVKQAVLSEMAAFDSQAETSESQSQPTKILVSKTSAIGATAFDKDAPNEVIYYDGFPDTKEPDAAVVEVAQRKEVTFGELRDGDRFTRDGDPSRIFTKVTTTNRNGDVTSFACYVNNKRDGDKPVELFAYSDSVIVDRLYF